MPKMQVEDRRDLIARAANLVDSNPGTWTHSQDDAYRIAKTAEHEIQVRDNQTNLLVAFSCTKADYEQSMIEFVSDYIVR